MGNSEQKQRRTLWLSAESVKKIESHMEDDNCKSNSEFVEKAVNFYVSYLDTGKDSLYLPKLLDGAIEAHLEVAVTGINRNLFKTAVELDILSNLLASAYEVPESELARLRARAVENCRHINGVIGFEAAYHRQNGEDEDHT